MARFAPLYDVVVTKAEADVRVGIDTREKYGLPGPGAASRGITVHLTVESPAGPEAVRKMIQHAERGCHAAATVREPVSVDTQVTLNGNPLP